MTCSILLPYCPLPVDTGAKTEIWKHLHVLREIGPCRILSAATKPVGTGWNPDTLRAVQGEGFEVVLRESSLRRNAKQWLGIFYACLCKGLRLERAFGHSNPYHRWAFPVRWWQQHTQSADLAVINYSYWAWLPCACPKVVVLHDLLSDVMCGGWKRETDDIKTADAVIVVSKNEEEKLRQRGIQSVFWSPPVVQPAELPVSAQIGVVGSQNRFNVEGLRWLEGSDDPAGVAIRVYGALGQHVQTGHFQNMGTYSDNLKPYRECGIILLTTKGGTGVQIKAVEALAYGRAIVARKGAMRGLPLENKPWIEVNTPAEMIAVVGRLSANDSERERLANAAREYYNKHLSADKVISNLRSAYIYVARRNR